MGKLEEPDVNLDPGGCFENNSHGHGSLNLDWLRKQIKTGWIKMVRNTKRESIESPVELLLRSCVWIRTGAPGLKDNLWLSLPKQLSFCGMKCTIHPRALLCEKTRGQLEPTGVRSHRIHGPAPYKQQKCAFAPSRCLRNPA